MTKQSKLDKQAEAEIMSAVEKVASLVAGGETPTEAVVKVAESEKLSAGYTQLVCQAYNTGRTQLQLQEDSLEEKAASFALADAPTVLERMFPKTVKTAAQIELETTVSDEYSRPPRWYQQRLAEKRSEELPKLEDLIKDEPKPQALRSERNHLKDAYDRIQKDEQHVARVRMKAAEARDGAHRLADQVTDYFRRPGCHSFPTCKRHVERMFGKNGEALMRMVERKIPFVKKHAADSHTVDMDQAPYTLIKAALDKAVEFKVKEQEYIKVSEQAEKVAEAATRPFCQSRRPSILDGLDQPSSSEKQAIGATGLGMAAMGTGLANNIQNLVSVTPEQTAEAVQKQKLQLADPAHESELRNIQAMAQLHDLMMNDQIISGYDPEQVIDAYNAVSQVAPEASRQRLFMQAMIRKHLEQNGAVDPFDIDQAAGLENKVRKNMGYNISDKPA